MRAFINPLERIDRYNHCSRDVRMTIVRQYESRDEPQFREIVIRNYAEQLSKTRTTDPDDPAVQVYLEHIIHMQQDSRGVILVAEQGNTLIGFVCLLGPGSSNGDKDSEGAYAFMSDLFVIPENRNNGVGSLLTQKIEEQARALGADNVALRVAADNSDSLRFYSRNRYQEKFVVMSKELSD